MTIKHLLSYLLATTLALGACKKDNSNDDQTDPEEVVSGITAAMKADSISTFTTALKSLSLTTEETREGITIFAPLNETLNTKVLSVKQPGTISETGTLPAKLSDAFLKAHIVKGLYKLADLAAGKTLTTLNGNTLTVIYRNNKLLVNGILVSGTDVATTSHGIVHITRSSLEDTQLNAPFTDEELIIGTQAAESNIAEWHRSMVMLDGFLSHDAEVASVSGSLPLYQSIGNFQFSPADYLIAQLWDKGFYQITNLNVLEKRVNATVLNRAPLISRIRAIRAYLYLQLLTYFENIPLLPTDNLPARLSNAYPQKVHDFIRSELEAVIPLLPSVTQAAGPLNGIAAKTLLARYHLLRKEYQKVLSLTSEVIADGHYGLAPLNQIFSSDREIIWDHSSSLSAVVKGYFFDRNRLPHIRLAEVYLMNAEANFILGNEAAARNMLGPLLQRRNIQQTNISLAELKELWRVELQREGLSFPALRRWGDAAEILGRYGFNAPKHHRLPIPQREISLSPGIIQNEGY